MGRKPIGKRAMTAAERQRARRKREAAKIPQPVTVKMKMLQSIEGTDQEIIEITFSGGDQEARIFWASLVRDKLDNWGKKVFTGKTLPTKRTPKKAKAPAKKKRAR